MNTKGLTVNELIYENEVVLHGLLIHLPEIGLGDCDEAIAVLKDQSSVGITSTKPTSSDLSKRPTTN